MLVLYLDLLKIELIWEKNKNHCHWLPGFSLEFFLCPYKMIFMIIFKKNPSMISSLSKLLESGHNLSMLVLWKTIFFLLLLLKLSHVLKLIFLSLHSMVFKQILVNISLCLNKNVSKLLSYHLGTPKQSQSTYSKVLYFYA